MIDKKTRKADIIAVAKAARVSPSTVSRSFNHPQMVNPATRKKITRAVERLGYIRNRAAQTMHGRRSGTIGLIVPTINHTIFSQVIQSFSDAIDAAGFTLLITSHGYDLDREYAMLRKLLEHRVDGIALIGFEHTTASFNMIEQQDIPTIAIWNYMQESTMSCVGADNVLAGRLAAQHLLSLGHRKIGLVFPSVSGNDRAGDRQSGVLATLAESAVTVPDFWRTQTPYSIAQAKQVCIDLLALDHRPTALLCGNDVIAQGAVFASQHMGLNVPGDVSVIGIGDFVGSEDMEPGLTTIRIPAQKIGKIAGDQLTQAITSENNQVFRYRCELQCVVRGTTARPNMNC
ncbi:LacI family DNA-binding transcriptional regulator [Sedimentitalea todarodis]|uniref:LacI family DNA-binding transcriptional regulator n=1 Tax=Sedimentitalea todarodis TaxID=1631240 RepID=A0ABU3VDZ9_9RHOB|nr:LacI family DNA-binding transcriptional regulator [Sedimentitalea todarodis]MDU9004398.1 LacI family DNA-binding transcriptional regulator [Sedimentitalea todarodis]